MRQSNTFLCKASLLVCCGYGSARIRFISADPDSLHVEKKSRKIPKKIVQNYKNIIF